MNGYLVEITSGDEDQFLKEQAVSLNIHNNIDCFKTSSNRYNGFKSTTYDGHTCQRWDSQTPHKHSRNQADRFPDASVADAANYCRDPDDEGLPWCYTTDPDVRWQLCGIYKCTGGNYWAGMTVLGENWKWMHTQTKLDEGYTNWGQNQHRLGNCGVLAAELNYQWKKKKCSYPAKFICEKVKY